MIGGIIHIDINRGVPEFVLNLKSRKTIYAFDLGLSVGEGRRSGQVVCHVQQEPNCDQCLNDFGIAIGLHGGPPDQRVWGVIRRIVCCFVLGGFFGLLVSRHCIPAGSYWKTGVTVSPGP